MKTSTKMDKEATSTEELKRNLNPLNIWALAVGAIIGFGCFVLPPDFLSRSGPLGASLGLIIGAISMSIIGLNISFLVEKHPVAGGQFEFAYKILGKRHGFVCGWMLSLCYISLISMNATALGVLAQYLAPSFFTKGYLYTIADWNVYLPQILLSVLFIIVFGVFNYRGGKIAGNMQLIMVGMMIASVLLIAVGTLLSDQSGLANLKPGFPSGIKPRSAVLAMISMSPWLFVGFDTIPTAAEEFNFSPRKTRGLIISSIWVGCLIYICVMLCVGSVMPWQEMVDAHYVWATGETMSRSIGSVGVFFLSVAVFMGICTGMNGFYLAGSRLLLAMSREKILPKWFGDIHGNHKTPVKSIKLIIAISLIAPFFGRTAIGWVVDMCSCGTAIAYLYSSLSVLKTMASDKQDRMPVKKAHFIMPLLGVVCSIVILFLLLIPGTSGSMGKESWIALVIWAICGFAFYRAHSAK